MRIWLFICHTIAIVVVEIGVKFAEMVGGQTM